MTNKEITIEFIVSTVLTIMLGMAVYLIDQAQAHYSVAGSRWFTELTRPDGGFHDEGQTKAIPDGSDGLETKVRRAYPGAKGQAAPHVKGRSGLHPEATESRTEQAMLANCGRGRDHGRGKIEGHWCMLTSAWNERWTTASPARRPSQDESEQRPIRSWNNQEIECYDRYGYSILVSTHR
jgi:hypothetical protein